jgi:hypothetical protein
MLASLEEGSVARNALNVPNVKDGGEAALGDNNPYPTATTGSPT